MKKTRKFIGCLLWAGLCMGAVSCNDDDLDAGSILPPTEQEKNEFDIWLDDNYVAPYNIEVKYKWEDIESDPLYDLSPAGMKEAIKLAKIIKYVWLESYDEVAGIGFLRQYVPKQIFMIGSAAYDADTQTVMLGTAEGGMKVLLYDVNNINDYLAHPERLNAGYFHVMHHEFSHVLHQTKPYSPDFEKITEGEYIGAQWSETADTEAHKKGYVTSYAMDQPDEDFAETISCYITNDAAWWEALLQDAGEEGAALITRKFEMVKNYLQDSWEIDIDRLRTTVLRRTGELGELDLETLN